MPDFSAETLQGIVYALGGMGGVAGVKWLVAGKAKQIDAVPGTLHQIELRLVEMAGRMARAESEIANDKAGRAAIASVQTDLAVIRNTVAAIQTEQRDMWNQINKTKGGGGSA